MSYRMNYLKFHNLYLQLFYLNSTGIFKINTELAFEKYISAKYRVRYHHSKLRHHFIC